MEPRKQMINPIQKLVQWFASYELTSSEYLFFILATVIETAVPVIFFFLPYRFAIAEQVMIILVALLFLFGVYMDIHTFFQGNYINYMYFQLSMYTIILLISAILIGMRKDAIADAVNLNLSSFYSSVVAVVCFLCYAVISFLVLVILDMAMVVVLVVYGKLAKIDMKNPYMEQLKAARTPEGFHEYSKRKFHEEYEKNTWQGYGEDAGETGQHYTYGRTEGNQTTGHQAKGHQTEGNQTTGHQTESRTTSSTSSYARSVYEPKPLFDYTKHFKDITSLDQVKPRYHALMKRYHPDNARTDTVLICQEIQGEYQDIVKRYNL